MIPAWVLPSIIGISFIISLANQLINNKLVDREFVKNKRKELKELQKSITMNSTKKEIDEAQTRMMAVNSELMKATMKPTMYTMLPLLGIFWALGNTFRPYGDLITLPISIPLFGTGISWLGTYIISSMIFGMTIRPLITKIDEFKKKKGVSE